MPQRKGGSKRVAARQTQLGQRKKRQQRGATAISPARDPLGVPMATDAQVTAPSQEYRPEAPRPAPKVHRPVSSRRIERTPPAFVHVKAEMRRIGVLTAVILLILVVLTVVLR